MKKIFIASSNSSESLGKAQMIKYMLNALYDDPVKNQNIYVDCWSDYPGFRPGDYTLEALEKAGHEYSAGVFILDRDDELSTADKEGCKYVPRDNVLIELGIFCGSLGRKSIAICIVPGVHIPSDLKGLTRINYSPNNSATMKNQLRGWVDEIPDVYGLPPKNIYIGPRKRIHESCSLDARFHISDKAYKHISDIRIMNLACNLFLNPEVADAKHLNVDGTSPIAKEINRIMGETSAVLRLILIEPSKFNLFDAKTKIANHRAGGPDAAVTSAIRSVYHMLTSDTLYKKLFDTRFEFYLSRISLPFAIFNVEFTPDYKRYNHIKVDLYSAELDTEDNRRSFIIWERDDPDNYHFFLDSFNRLRMDSESCIRISKGKESILSSLV